MFSEDSFLFSFRVDSFSENKVNIIIKVDNISNDSFYYPLTGLFSVDKNIIYQHAGSFTKFDKNVLYPRHIFSDYCKVDSVILVPPRSTINLSWEIYNLDNLSRVNFAFTFLFLNREIYNKLNKGLIEWHYCRLNNMYKRWTVNYKIKKRNSGCAFTKINFD